MFKTLNNLGANPAISGKPITHIKKLEQGKQGVVGLLSIEDVIYVYKISQYMNYLPQHEYIVMKGLEEIEPYCPFFCKAVGILPLKLNPNYKSAENPFDTTGKEKTITLDVLIMEFVPEATNLLDLINNDEVGIDVILACIKQTMLAMVYAQQEKQFAHYDLHSMNILTTDIGSPDDVFLYVLDKDNAFCVPTMGKFVTIIDFGFSTIKNVNDHNMFCSLSYTDSGYMSPGYDPMADPKIFLVSVSDDLVEYKPNSDVSVKFRNVVKNIFEPLRIDWRSGWDKKRGELPLVDQIFNYIENIDERSKLFSKYPHYCMDILQGMIELPLSKHTVPDLKLLKKSYRAFVQEFFKLEETLGNLYYTLYVFRNLIDIARNNRKEYENSETRELSIAKVKNELFDTIQEVAKFCSVDHVDFNLLLCSLYVFQDQLETHLYYKLNKVMKQKFKSYRNLDIQSLEKMFSLIDINFPIQYTFNKNTEVFVWDLEKRCNYRFKLDEEYVKILNEISVYKRGSVLYQVYSAME
jgi:hypothetical protein